jgi:hypothetical protein
MNVLRMLIYSMLIFCIFRRTLNNRLIFPYKLDADVWDEGGGGEGGGGGLRSFNRDQSLGCPFVFCC